MRTLSGTGVLIHDLDLEFSRPNMEFAISQPKVFPLSRNEKQTYRLNSRPHLWPMGLTLVMTLIFEFSRPNVCDLDLWSQTCPWASFFMVKFWNIRISEWEGWLTLNKEGWSRSSMTVTIWWSRSGVRIYQIVTRVTSDVGVSSTHLVIKSLSFPMSIHDSIFFM